MKHICFFSGNANLAGGTERVMAVIANGLAQRGYTISILSLCEGEKPFFPLHPSITVDRLFQNRVSFSRNYFVTIARLRTFIRSRKVNVLIDVESILAFFAVPGLALAGVHHICWEHFSYKVDLGRKVRRVARHLAAVWADDVVTLTAKDKTYWEVGTWVRANITAISNPIPFDIPDHSPSSDSRLALAVGHLKAIKGFDDLVRAWSRIAHEVPNWRLRIVGNGEEKNALERLVVETGMEDRVELCPATRDIERHYRDAAIYCLSSRFEGFPMVLIEAQAYGLPAVAFDCELGPREILEDFKTGRLIKPGDVAAYSQALLSLISEQSVRTQYSINAKKNVVRFRPEAILAQWEAIIEGHATSSVA